jgi:type II secretory pathway pseudopilin PulG
MRLFNKIKTLRTDYAGFTLVEILVSLGALSILLLVITTVVSTTASVNSRTNLNTDAGVAAFQKVQDYVNTSFDSITIGDDATSYEVEDFSGDANLDHLKNVEAKLYVEPASVVNSGTTTETTTITTAAAVTKRCQPSIWVHRKA